MIKQKKNSLSQDNSTTAMVIKTGSKKVQSFFLYISVSSKFYTRTSTNKFMSLEIATTIWNQINAGGRLKVITWGVPLSSRVGSDEDGGWLRFKVSGLKFKGLVKVIYVPGKDIYKIEFLKKKRVENSLSGLVDYEFKVVHTIEEAYCDNLTELIDEYVEKIPAYKH